MAVNVVQKVDGPVLVKNVLISVSDKTGLDTFVPELVKLIPDVRIYSTGGTYDALARILGPGAKKTLVSVADYTGQPETQGGLVKTLDFKVYLGLLTETYNEAHAMDRERTGSVCFDMVVVNLYPFAATVRSAGATPEMCRGQIDIGGPCMIRAAAKNFLRVAMVTEAEDYGPMLHEIKTLGGATALRTRFRLARKAFRITAVYDRAIADYFKETFFDSVAPCYEIIGSPQGTF
ncbi:MAG: hypothetical protein AB1921_02170 [Thermodesulfobacteriota bacterium]